MRFTTSISAKQSVSAIIIYLIGVIAVFLITPQSLGLAKYKLPSSDVYLMPADLQIVPNRFAANPTTRKMNSQFNRHSPDAKRFHSKFEEDWPIAGPRTIYIPSAGGETRVFINGAPIPVSDTMTLYAPGFGTDWVAYDMPRWQLVPGTNRLDVHLQSDPIRAGIREIFIAPRDKARQVIGGQSSWMEWLPVLAATLSVIVILLSLGGLAIGRDRLRYLIAGCLGGVILFQAAMSFLSPVEPFTRLGHSMRFILPAIILGLLIILWRRDRQSWRGPAGLKAALYSLALTGPVLSLAAMLLPILVPHPLQTASFALAGPLLLLIPKNALDFRADLGLRRSRLEKLRAKVSEQAEALDEKSQVIAREMQKRAVLEERQRFTRDIHDGIGGQLLSLLLRVRTGKVKPTRIAEEIQQGLNDLRLVVDSMDHTGDDLNAALATFRMRAESQLKAADIHFAWQQSEEIFARFSTTRGTLILYRFMQEALTNIVRHANAAHVKISITQISEDDPLIIRIADDGIGLTPQAKNGAGKGLKNLRARADSLKADLNFHEGLDGQGLTVELIIPSTP